MPPAHAAGMGGIDSADAQRLAGELGRLKVEKLQLAGKLNGFVATVGSLHSAWSAMDSSALYVAGVANSYRFQY
jgi:hypothetical protein